MPWSTPGGISYLQGASVVQVQGAGGAAERFLQGYGHRILRRRPAGVADQILEPEAAAAAEVVKAAAGAEQIAEIGAVAGGGAPAETAAGGAAMGAGLFVFRGVAPVFAVAVIFGAGVGVRQHVVGFVDFLEFILGGGIVLVDVRVVLPRQPAVRLADFLFRGVFGDAQDFVVAAHIAPPRRRFRALAAAWPVGKLLCGYGNS